MSIVTLHEPAGGRVVRDPFGCVLTTPEEIAEFEAWIDASQKESYGTTEGLAQFSRYMDDLQAEYERNGSWFDEDPPEHEPDYEPTEEDMAAAPTGHTDLF